MGVAEAIERSHGPRMEWHAGQDRFYRSKTRFNICHAARRSGKSEVAKLRFKRAVGLWGTKDWQRGLVGRFLIGAPTLAQVRAIYLGDIRRMLAPIIVSETLTPFPQIRTMNGVEVSLMGLDSPARIEGQPWHRALIDEYANCKEEVWQDHLRPALATKGQVGSADFIGVPEGRNHYYRLVQRAKTLIEEAEADGDRAKWAIHHWPSSDIIPEEAEEARHELDPLTWLQEFGGEFVAPQGQAYYRYDDELHRGPLFHVPDRPLLLGFDFNWRPGVAVIAQEIEPPQWLIAEAAKRGGGVEQTIIAVLDEVWIGDNSNTQKVAQQVVDRWSSQHRGDVEIFGDPAGRQHKSGQLDGTDWQIIERELQRVPHWNVRRRVPRSHPLVKTRVNIVNSTLLSADGTVRLAIATDCRRLRNDFEGVQADSEGSIAKDKGGELTHISDALGYLVCERAKKRPTIQSLSGGLYG